MDRYCAKAVIRSIHPHAHLQRRGPCERVVVRAVVFGLRSVEQLVVLTVLVPLTTVGLCF